MLRYIHLCVVNLLDTLLTRRYNPYFFIRDMICLPFAFWFFYVEKRPARSIPYPFASVIYRFHPKLAEQDGDGWVVIRAIQALDRENDRKRARS